MALNSNAQCSGDSGEGGLGARAWNLLLKPNGDSEISVTWRGETYLLSASELRRLILSSESNEELVKSILDEAEALVGEPMGAQARKGLRVGLDAWCETHAEALDAMREDAA